MEENLRSERKEMILSFVQDKDYRPIRTKEMANLFGVPKRDRSDFHELLDELIREGKIEIDRRGMIRLPENRIFTGTFMATRTGCIYTRATLLQCVPRGSGTDSSYAAGRRGEHKTQ